MFVLSLDCEGLWGMLDQPELLSSGVISNQLLLGAYQQLTNLLDKTGVVCTAAFVSAFAAPADLLHSQLDLIHAQAEENPLWLSTVAQKIRKGPSNLDGYLGHSMFRMLHDAGHEIGWHGSTHVSWDQASESSVTREIQLFKIVNAELSVSPKSMIFPRNAVGQVSRLAECGINSYRAGPAPGGRSRIGNLLKEFGSRNASETACPVPVEGVLMHPEGDFLNWPRGLRRMVPNGVTVARWKNMVDRAIAKGGYVHMWFHPHNLITAPSMFIILEEVLQHVGQRIRYGDIRNLSMAQHSSELGF